MKRKATFACWIHIIRGFGYGDVKASVKASEKVPARLVGLPILSILALLVVMMPVMASKVNSSTPEVSSTIMKMFS